MVRQSDASTSWNRKPHAILASHVALTQAGGDCFGNASDCNSGSNGQTATRTAGAGQNVA